MNLKYYANKLPFLEKINRIFSILFFTNLILFASFLFQDIFLNFNALGDESKYLGDLLNANKNGIGKAILDGTSITYLVISFWVNKIVINPILSLKITSFIIGIITFWFLLIFNKKYLQLSQPLKIPAFQWIAYLFVIQATIFIGVNDILLDFFGALLLITLILPFKKILIKVILVGIFLALMLATRKMAITYIFVFFIIYFAIALFLNDNFNFNLKRGFLILFSFIFSFLIFNSYSLIKQQNFSFDDKILNGDINWAQWDYHNALLIDKGLQNRFQHVNIQETEKYLKENGIASLPSNFIEMIFFKPSLTIKEFFIDMAIGLKYITRQTGLMIFSFFIFLVIRLRRVYKTKVVTNIDFVYLFSLFYFLIISFIVITNVQPRWFMLFLPIILLLVAKDLNQVSKKNQLIFSISNNAILIIMCIPYLIEKFNEYL